MRPFYIILVTFLFAACISKYDCPRIENQDLERAILEYDSIVKADKHKSQYLLCVSVSNLNDSVEMYHVYYTLCGRLYLEEPNVSICKAKDEDVIFTYRYSKLPENIQFATEEQRHKLWKKHFPEQYEKYLKNPNRVELITNDAPGLILLFYKGKLVNKTYGY